VSTAVDRDCSRGTARNAISAGEPVAPIDERNAFSPDPKRAERLGAREGRHQIHGATASRWADMYASGLKGGGWRAHGRGQVKRAKVGYAFVHSAVDGYTRIAYSEVLLNEQGVTAAEFWTRAAAFFAALGIVIERVLTDNGLCYRSSKFNDALGEHVHHTFIRAYRPQTNGKVERFNRTLFAEWAYARTWTSEGQRTRALARWLHIYNHHRHHTAIGGTPITRVSNLAGHYS
jgi:transposase InsO family protein